GAACGAPAAQPRLGAAPGRTACDARVTDPAQVGGADNAPTGDAMAMPATGTPPAPAVAADSTPAPISAVPAHSTASASGSSRPPFANPRKFDAVDPQLPAPISNRLARTAPGVLGAAAGAAAPANAEDSVEPAADELTASVASYVPALTPRVLTNASYIAEA